MTELWMRTATFASIALAASLPLILISRQRVLLQRWLVWLVLFALFGVTSLIFVTTGSSLASVILIAAISIGMLIELLRLRVAKGFWLLAAAVWLIGIPTIWISVAPDKLFALFLLVALFDIGGWVGGHSPLRRGFLASPLALKISPNKTWAGMVGSVAFLVLASIPVGLLNIWQLVAVAVLATGGDLLESWVKRLAGVKDAGRILPGFGGLLDRFDSLVLAGLVLVLL